MRLGTLCQGLRRLRQSPAVALVTALTVVTIPAVAGAQGDGNAWVGTWATAAVVLPPPPVGAPQGQGPGALRIRNQTVRQIVRTSIGGTAVRVAVTNLFGSRPLEVGAAHVALRVNGATIDPGTVRPLLFDGQPAVSIAAGAMALSDSVELGVPALGDLAIDLYLPGDSQADPAGATVHSAGLTTNYLSSTGRHGGVAELPVERTFQSWFYLSRVEVSAPEGTPVIVTLGDSITDGTASTPDTNSRWPDFLARRLVARRGNTPPAVLNVGIAGNRVLSDNAGLGILRRDANAPPPPPPNPNARFGPSALSRLDREVLDQPGVTHVIVFESTNDIGMAFESESPTVEEIIAGHVELIERAHARGLKVYGGTLAPFEGAFYFRDIGETKRQALNEWIRTSGAYDAVIDFDAAVRDPAQPSKMIEAYQSGDWLHPSDEGYRVMAQAVDLALFEQ
jgi:lysophospholipase L1-like esterase